MGYEYITNQELVKYGGNGDVKNLSYTNYSRSTYPEQNSETSSNNSYYISETSNFNFLNKPGNRPPLVNNVFVNDNSLEIKTDLFENLNINPKLSLKLMNFDENIIIEKMAVTYLDMNYKRYIRGAKRGDTPTLSDKYISQTLPLSIKMCFKLENGIYNEKIIKNSHILFNEIWNKLNTNFPKKYMLDDKLIEFKKNSYSDSNQFISIENNIIYHILSEHYIGSNTFIINVTLSNLFDYFYKSYLYCRNETSINIDKSALYDIINLTDIFRNDEITPTRNNENVVMFGSNITYKKYVGETHFHKILNMVLSKCINIYKLKLVSENGIIYKVIDLNYHKNSLHRKLNIKDRNRKYFTTAINIFYEPLRSITRTTPISELYKNMTTIEKYYINDNRDKGISGEHIIYIYEYDLKHYQSARHNTLYYRSQAIMNWENADYNLNLINEERQRQEEDFERQVQNNGRR
jgi:hypothetical protein